MAPANLSVSLLLGIGSVMVYWGWAKWQGKPFDPVGLWALLIPPAVFVSGTWLFYRLRAPAQLFDELRQQLDRYRPQVPWVVAVEVAEEERRIAVRLLQRDGVTGTTTIDSATCFFALGDVRPACREPKSGIVGKGRNIKWEYPAEFDNPVWPLQEGTHQVVVAGITSPSLDGSASIGGKFEIGRGRGKRRRR